MGRTVEVSNTTLAELRFSFVRNSFATSTARFTVFTTTKMPSLSGSWEREWNAASAAATSSFNSFAVSTSRTGFLIPNRAFAAGDGSLAREPMKQSSDLRLSGIVAPSTTVEPTRGERGYWRWSCSTSRHILTAAGARWGSSIRMRRSTPVRPACMDSVRGETETPRNSVWEASCVTVAVMICAPTGVSHSRSGALPPWSDVTRSTGPL